MNSQAIRTQTRTRPIAVPPLDPHPPEGVEELFETFLASWPGVCTDEQLRRLLSKLNRRGWRCAVVDGGRSADPAAWKLFTASGHNWQVRVASVREGLHSLDLLQSSRQFECIVLRDIPCSLARVHDWLTWTPGRGCVLWLRGGEAFLLQEHWVHQARTLWLERFGLVLERILKSLDRWG
ncbi:MAG: hypothetical protein H7Y22_07910 [Gemmatimonadaceae bacterium]|nr:hypothetical protein [Gloeobacterales cyanobacterium ES-bin-141]